MLGRDRQPQRAQQRDGFGVRRQPGRAQRRRRHRPAERDLRGERGRSRADRRRCDEASRRSTCTTVARAAAMRASIEVGAAATTIGARAGGATAAGGCARTGLGGLGCDVGAQHGRRESGARRRPGAVRRPGVRPAPRRRAKAASSTDARPATTGAGNAAGTIEAATKALGGGATGTPGGPVSTAASAPVSTICSRMRSPSNPVTRTCSTSPGRTVGGSDAATRRPAISSRSVRPFDGSTRAVTTAFSTSSPRSACASAASCASSASISAARSALPATIAASGSMLMSGGEVDQVRRLVEPDASSGAGAKASRGRPSSGS